MENFTDVGIFRPAGLRKSFSGCAGWKGNGRGSFRQWLSHDAKMMQI